MKNSIRRLVLRLHGIGITPIRLALANQSQNKGDSLHQSQQEPA